MVKQPEFKEDIKRNLEQMGTALGDWRAAPVRRDREGNPHFAVPVGYERAPTLFPDLRRDGPGICELCGHRIGSRYWITNDRRRWTLTVGSECIKKFKGKGRQAHPDEADR